jgi:hypothetical protein
MHWTRFAVNGSWLLLVVGLTLAGAATATAQQEPESKNMELVGYSDLQGRSAYQPVIQKQGDRWILYMGHHGGSALNPLTGKEEANGTSILDVTDPKHPKYLFHIPGEPGGGGGGDAGGSQMVRVCNGSELPHAEKNKVYLLRPFGNTAQEVWDVTDPAKPTRITVVVSGLLQTHKNWWECDTGIAYLVSGTPGWRTRRMLKIYDLSNPAKPVFIRDFGLPGQQPGATGPVPSELHGPISLGPKRNRIYFAYSAGSNGVVQIVDRDKLLNGPKEPTNENLLYPQVSRLDLPPDVGAHTAFPLLGVDVADFGKSKGETRDFVVITGESYANDCTESRQMLHFIDITTETRPFGVSTWGVPAESGNFCGAAGRGGRFGTHSTNENFSPIYYKRLLFVTHFSAGLRALDIRDPYHPQEVAYYIPGVTDKTQKACLGKGADAHCKTVIQTNNVEVDDRGYIYISDRAGTGMHLLQLGGAARQIANLR